MKTFDTKFDAVVGQQVLSAMSYTESSHLVEGVRAIAASVWSQGQSEGSGGAGAASGVSTEPSERLRSASPGTVRFVLLVTDCVSTDDRSGFSEARETFDFNLAVLHIASSAVLSRIASVVREYVVPVVFSSHPVLLLPEHCPITAPIAICFT